MYECECAFRRFDGGIRFIREARMNEAKDDLCTLRVRFEITQIFPPEKETGAEMDYLGDIATIEMRGFTGDWKRWRVLRGEELETAKLFLLEAYGEELWNAASDHAEALYLGKVA
jgi:hypothetical protein